MKWYSYSPYKPGVVGAIFGFSSIPDETLNRSTMTIFQDKLLTRTYCDEAGGYDVHNVLSLRDLVSRPDLSDKNCTTTWDWLFEINDAVSLTFR